MKLKRGLDAGLNEVSNNGKKITKTKNETKKSVRTTIDHVHFLFSEKLISEILTDTARKCIEYGRPNKATLISEESLKKYLREEFDKKINKENFLISREEFDKLHSIEREELLISIGLRIFFPNYKKESRDLYLSLIILQLKRKIIAKEFIIFG